MLTYVFLNAYVSKRLIVESLICNTIYFLSRSIFQKYVGTKYLAVITVLTVYFAIIQSTFYRLIKGQHYLKKMYETN